MYSSGEGVEMHLLVDSIQSKLPSGIVNRQLHTRFDDDGVLMTWVTGDIDERGRNLCIELYVSDEIEQGCDPDAIDELGRYFSSRMIDASTFELFKVLRRMRGEIQ